MRDINRITLLGRLGKDPEFKMTQNGNPMAKFPVATARRVKQDEETWADQTQWHAVVVWGKSAENCQRFLKKGAIVFVEGTYLSRKYEAKDGQERWIYEVNADELSFIPSGQSKVDGANSEAGSEKSASVA